MPNSFDDLGKHRWRYCEKRSGGQKNLHQYAAFSSGKLVKDTFSELVDKGIVVLRPEIPPPAVPMDYAWARVSKTPSKNA